MHLMLNVRRYKGYISRVSRWPKQ